MQKTNLHWVGFVVFVFGLCSRRSEGARWGLPPPRPPALFLGGSRPPDPLFGGAPPPRPPAGGVWGAASPNFGGSGVREPPRNKAGGREAAAPQGAKE
jgi:hypothetical protein